MHLLDTNVPREQTVGKYDAYSVRKVLLIYQPTEERKDFDSIKLL